MAVVRRAFNFGTSNKTSSTTLVTGVIGGTDPPQVGDLLIFGIGYDPSGAGLPTISTITVAGGGAIGPITKGVRSGNVAGAGANGGYAWCYVTTAMNTTATSITITLSAAVTAKMVNILAFSGAGNPTVFSAPGQVASPNVYPADIPVNGGAFLFGIQEGITAPSFAGGFIAQTFATSGGGAATNLALSSVYSDPSYGSASSPSSISTSSATSMAFVLLIPPAATTGPVTASPGGIVSAEAFGTPAAVTTTPGTTASPGGIASAQALGSPSASTPLVASPAGVPSSEAFGTPATAPPSGDSLRWENDDLPAAGATVTTWTDRSGAGRDGSSDTNGPIVTAGAAGTPNGGRAAYFDGTRTPFSLPAFASGTTVEYWLLVRSNGVNTGLWTVGASGGINDENHYPYNGVVYESAGLASGQRKSFTPTLPITDWRVYLIQSDGVTWTAKLDGVVQVTTTVAVTPGHSTAPIIGQGTNSGGPDMRFSGYIAGLRVRPVISTATEEADYAAQLIAKHGLTGYGARVAYPAAVPSSETLGAPSATVAPPAITASPAAVPSAQALGSPSASTPLTASPAGVASAGALGAPSATGALTNSPTGIASAEAFGLPAVSAVLTASPVAVSTGGAFGVPAVSATLTSSPPSVASAEAFGLPASGVVLASSPAGVPSSEAFGTPAATGTLTSSPATVSSAEAFGTPAATGALTSTPGAIATAEAFGLPASLAAGSSSPTGIPSAEAFGSPATVRPVTSSPPSVASLEAFGVPTVSQALTASPAGVASLEALGAPTALATLTASPGGVPTGVALGLPSATVLAAATTASPAAVTSLEALGSPVVLTVLVVQPGGITTAEAFGLPVAGLRTPGGGIHEPGGSTADNAHHPGGLVVDTAARRAGALTSPSARGALVLTPTPTRGGMLG